MGKVSDHYARLAFAGKLYGNANLNPYRKNKKKSNYWQRKSYAHKRQINSEFFQSERWEKLRSSVIRHYGCVCMKCGHTGSQENKIHVDHIVPRSVNKKLQWKFSNLQVLCAICNFEKGVKTVDYRKLAEIRKGGCA